MKIDPTSYDEAMRSSDRNNWQQAIQSELKALKDMGVYRLVTLPDGVKPIGCRWVFTTKRDAFGNVLQWKARLVAQGFTQRAGIDYTETFAPVARMQAVRLLCALAALLGGELHSADVDTAFLNAKSDTDLYMRLPPGVKQNKDFPLVMFLLKALYGLKQSPKLWNDLIDEAYGNICWKPTKSDPCLYVHSSGSLIALHVDDMLMLLLGTAQERISIKNEVLRMFKCKDLGRTTVHCGVNIHQSAADQNSCISVYHSNVARI